MYKSTSMYSMNDVRCTLCTGSCYIVRGTQYICVRSTIYEYEVHMYRYIVALVLCTSYIACTSYKVHSSPTMYKVKGTRVHSTRFCDSVVLTCAHSYEMYIVHRTLYIVHRTMHSSVQGMMYACTMYKVLCILVHMYIVPCTCTMYTCT